MRALILVAFLTLALTACDPRYSVSVGVERPAPTPQIIYVRDETAIADARTDGEISGILAAGLAFVAVAVFFGARQAMVNAAAEQEAPRRPAQLPPVTHITNNFDQRTVTIVMPSAQGSEGRKRAKELIDGTGREVKR